MDEETDGISVHEYHSLLGSCTLGIRRWPVSFGPLTGCIESDHSGEGELAESITYAAVNGARKFCNEKEFSSDLVIQHQLACVELFVYEVEAGDSTRYMSSKELMGLIVGPDTDDMSYQYFRTKIIAKLRDAGLLIASSNQGYKLATCVGDCISFVNVDNKMIMPMVARLRIFRESIRLATQGKIDPLNRPEFYTLKALLDLDEEGSGIV